MRASGATRTESVTEHDSLPTVEFKPSRRSILLHTVIPTERRPDEKLALNEVEGSRERRNLHLLCTAARAVRRLTR